jgi:hypothetical protein
MSVSRDGGRTWARVAVVGIPVREVTAHERLVCWAKSSSEPCTLFAVDPVQRRMAPLAKQPALYLMADVDRFDQAGTVVREGSALWVSGLDRTSGRAAVAVSRDAGQTWAEHVYDLPSCPSNRCSAPTLASRDGRTVYAIISDQYNPQRYVYRHRDGRGWEPSGSGTVSGSSIIEPVQSFVTGDGVHVIHNVVMGDQRGYLASRSNGEYVAAELAGLPDHVTAIKRAPDGTYYTYDQSTSVCYTSATGWKWTPVTTRR